MDIVVVVFFAVERMKAKAAMIEHKVKLSMQQKVRDISNREFFFIIILLGTPGFGIVDLPTGPATKLRDEMRNANCSNMFINMNLVV